MLTAPCFHLVAAGEPPPHVRHLYQCHRPSTFEKDLDLLLKRGTPVSLRDIEEHVESGTTLPKRALFVSFDDGMREMEDIVAPICSAKGVPVTFFLSTGFLDNRSLFFRHKASLLIDRLETQDANESEIKRVLERRGVTTDDPRGFFRTARYSDTSHLDACAGIVGLDFGQYLRDKKPYLTEDQVDCLLRKGFTIGGHSVDHPLFGDLDHATQVEQTRVCMQHLESRFAIRFKAFAFPFVSDGVPRTYYDTVFKEGIADIAFCIGETPTGYNGRTVERFGVENQNSCSASAALRKQGKK